MTAFEHKRSAATRNDSFSASTPEAALPAKRKRRQEMTRMNLKEKIAKARAWTGIGAVGCADI
jgi:hypothetical protein